LRRLSKTPIVSCFWTKKCLVFFETGSGSNRSSRLRSGDAVEYLAAMCNTTVVTACQHCGPNYGFSRASHVFNASMLFAETVKLINVPCPLFKLPKSKLRLVWCDCLQYQRDHLCWR
jgi:hypothetical protein